VINRDRAIEWTLLIGVPVLFFLIWWVL